MLTNMTLEMALKLAGVPKEEMDDYERRHPGSTKILTEIIQQSNDRSSQYVLDQAAFLEAAGVPQCEIDKFKAKFLQS